MLEKLGLVIARKWIGGVDIQSAISEARKANTLGERAVLNYLGEDHTSKKLVGKDIKEYIDLMKAMKKGRIRGSLSVKPTQLGLMISKELYGSNLAAIARMARSLGIFVWLDMEDYDLIPKIIDGYVRVHKRYSNTGYESINFTNYSAHVPAGSKIGEAFKLNLVNGSYSFATTISVGNQGALASNRIVTIIQNNTGNPPFSGTLYITPTSSAKSGQYYVSLIGSSYNMTVLPATILLYVLPYGTQTTTIPPPPTTSYNTTSTTTISASNFTSSIATTSVLSAASTQPPFNINSFYYVLVIALIVVVVIIFFITRRQGGSVPPAQPPTQKA